MTTLTIHQQDLVAIGHDLYRDIHKGIRAELFDVTLAAGRLDPANRDDHADVAAHLRSVVDLLVSHAEHEDGAIQPVLEAELPSLAERIATDHERLEVRVVALADLADVAMASSSGTARFDTHRLYVELAAFTSSYLEHQDVEERVVMPAIESLLGVEGVLELHQAIIGAIPPAELVPALAVMFPAMNVDDRTELLGGMHANAPAEVFDGVWSLVRSVLTSADASDVARRLGIST